MNGCPTWIRTMTDCSRGNRATITPSGKQRDEGKDFELRVKFSGRGCVS